MWNGSGNHLYAQGRSLSDFGGRVGIAISNSAQRSVRTENMATHRSPRPSANQGGPGIAKKDPGSFFTEMTFGLELTKYVSGRLSIYGNGISIFV